MFYNEWMNVPYLAFSVALFVGVVVLLVLLGRLMWAATRALQSYRRTQEVKLDLLLAGGEGDDDLRI